MRHTLPIAPQFYVTAPQVCPYLPDRIERKLFTSIQGDDAQILNDALSQQGFRRSQNILYRPSCNECSACLSARIDVKKFSPSKSQKKILRRNQFLSRRSNSPWATEEQYDLFQKYLRERHANGGMADMDVFEFAAMIEESSIETKVMEYYDKNILEAVCLTDVLSDGLSMVYSFFDPDKSKNSLGTFMILDHISVALDLGLPYLYLGYWVPGSQKMDYKVNFKGVEIFQNNKWRVLSENEEYKLDLHPLNTAPVSEQVSSLSLPDSTTT